jgi:hypothetical protein
MANSAPSAERMAQAGREALAEIDELIRGLRAHMREENGDPAFSLDLIARFFATVAAPDVAEHVGRIALAFYDRALGINDPIFMRGAKNKQDATQKWRGRMWAALGYACLLKAHMSQPKAAEHIDNKYKLAPLLRGSRNLRTSLPGWYDELMTNGKTPPTGVMRSFRILHEQMLGGGLLTAAAYRDKAKFCLLKAVEIAESVADGP